MRFFEKLVVAYFFGPPCSVSYSKWQTHLTYYGVAQKPCCNWHYYVYFFIFRMLSVDLLIYLFLCLPAVLGNKSKSKLESSSNSGQHQFVSCVVKGGSLADGESPFFSSLESWRDVAERIYSSAVVIGESCQPGRCSLRRSAMQICRARGRSRGV